MDKCSIKRCNNVPEVYYYSKPVCEKHWEWHCDYNRKFNLKEVLKIREPKIIKTIKPKIEKLQDKGRKCPSCKDYTIIDVDGGIKCERCSYAQYICPNCNRRFKKKFAITNHLRYCKG
jgi:hypothetical protein